MALSVFFTHTSCSTVEVTQALARSKLSRDVATTKYLCHFVVIMGHQCTNDKKFLQLFSTTVLLQPLGVDRVSFNSQKEFHLLSLSPEYFSVAMPDPVLLSAQIFAIHIVESSPYRSQ